MTYKIVSKYVKDLSFEIPDAKTFFLLEKNIKNYQIKIDISSKNLKEKIIEVDTRLGFEGKKDEKNNARVQILYSSVVTLEKEIQKEEMEKILLVKVPTEIYPDIQKIVSVLFEKSGFKTFSLDNIDFNKLHEAKKNQK